jgi:hypothetical protein
MKHASFFVLSFAAWLLPLHVWAEIKYVILNDGIALRDSFFITSKPISHIPYNAAVQIIESTTIPYHDGWLTGTWVKVKYGDVSGYCPGMWLHNNQIPDTATLHKLSFDSFLQTAFSGYFYICRHKTEEYHASDSVYITNADEAACYYIFRSYFADLPFPDVPGQREYIFQDCTLDISYQIDFRKTKGIIMNWVFDGGNTTLKFIKMNDGSSVVVDYYPD